MANTGSLCGGRQEEVCSQSFLVSLLCWCCLLPNPVVDVGTRKAPRPTHLERRNLLGSSEPVDGPFRDLQEVGDLLDGEDLILAGIHRHSDSQYLSNRDSVVQNFQPSNDG